MRCQINDLLTVKQVSRLLNISELSLEKWRKMGLGPEYIHTDQKQRSVKYSLEAVMCYLKEQKESEDLFKQP